MGSHLSHRGCRTPDSISKNVGNNPDTVHNVHHDSDVEVRSHHAKRHPFEGHRLPRIKETDLLEGHHNRGQLIQRERNVMSSE
mmetsp:Transcript_51977/g.58081  ORF Transcript_51977/g.58081 Transcript_51977/m.58081 type:complete len:83 (-) Transcript_51977:197-445(-)